MTDFLHEQALGLAKQYKESEAKLLDVLMQMAEKRTFVSLGYTGCFNYCLKALKLSEAQSSYFTRVSEKSREVPELKEAISNGTLSLSQARRVVSVINQENKAEWIEKAATLPQKELEREVTAVNPKDML